jgi:hypothetical protein
MTPDWWQMLRACPVLKERLEEHGGTTSNSNCPHLDKAASTAFQARFGKPQR